MKTALSLIIPLLLGAVISGADLYREIPIPRYGKLTRESILSPSGRYFVNRVGAADFEVVDLVTDEYVLQSQFSGRTTPDLDCRNPNHVEIAFSPDDRFLAADYYCVRGDTAEPAHWAEVWNTASRSTARLFPFRDRDRNEPIRFSYSLQSALPVGFSVAGSRRHPANAKVCFSPDGRKLCFLFPSLRMFDGGTFDEITGDFNRAGVDRAKNGLVTFNAIGAPFFLGGGRVLLSINRETFLFNEFTNTIRDYTKIEGRVWNVESSADGKLLLLDRKVFLTDFLAVRLVLPAQAYLSSNDSLILSGGSLYSAFPPFDRNVPTLFPGTPVPSSTREFLFVIDRLRDRLHIYAFGSAAALLQSILLSDDETLFSEAETGNRFLIRNNATGKVRLFEKQ